MKTKIKTLKSYLGILFLLSIFLVGCSSSSDDSSPAPDPTPVNPDLPTPDPEPDPNPSPSPFPIPTTVQFNVLRENALNSKKQTHDLALTQAGVFTVNNLSFGKSTGMTLTVANLSVNNAILEVGSNVQVELVELYDKADFITTGISTMGTQDNGERKMLETGGTFYVNVTSEGQATSNTYSSFSINVPHTLTGNVRSNMTLWKNISINPESFIWESGVSNGSNVGVSGTVYVASVLRFLDWFNIGRFWEDARPKTSALSVGVPTGYNQSNSAMYLSFNGIWGVGEIYYNTTTNTFSETGNYIPVGQQANAIFVSESDGKWVYAIKPFTVTQNTNIEILGTDLQAVTEEEITTLINALP